MDHYADDLAAVTAHLDLKDAIHVGHSTGGGEVVHYIARHGEGRVARAVLISSVPPLMVQTDANPGGLPKSVFDGLQAELAANRSVFYRALPSGPFYGFNRPGVESSEAIIENWWRQGMMGGAKAHYDGIVAFSQTDFTEDLKKITLPVLVHARRRRPDRSLRRLRTTVGGTRAERDAEVVQGLPARHADHAGRDDQRRPAGLAADLTSEITNPTSAASTLLLLTPLSPSPVAGTAQVQRRARRTSSGWRISVRTIKTTPAHPAVRASSAQAHKQSSFRGFRRGSGGLSMSDEPVSSAQGSPVGFESDIRPLFRESDRTAMRRAFDLWSYDDVVAHGQAIAGRLKDGSMPCDGAWPSGRVSLFERWLEQGAAK